MHDENLYYRGAIFDDTHSQILKPCIADPEKVLPSGLFAFGNKLAGKRIAKACQI